MKKTLYLMIIIILSCTGIKVERGLKDNYFVSNTPALKLKIDNTFKYIGENQRKFYIRGRVGRELEIEDTSYLFVAANNSGFINQGILISFMESTTPGFTWRDEPIKDPKKFIEHGIEEIDGKKYYFLIDHDRKFIRFRFEDNFFSEKGYLPPSTMLYKDYARITGKDVMLHIYYFELLPNMNWTTYSTVEPVFTEEQKEYIKSFSLRAERYIQQKEDISFQKLQDYLKEKKELQTKKTLEQPDFSSSVKESSEKINIDQKSYSAAAALHQVRWALVIGISNYKDSRITPLRYASRDGQLFYKWLISPSGGKYPIANVKLLLDNQATTLNMKDALFVWLAKALEEDIVTIYFAGHGSPQSPDKPNNLFLLPYDTDYDSIASTGFPMWDIETALKRFIQAKKVVVLADACHSGGVGREFDTVIRSNRGIKVTNPINLNLQNLSKISDNICIISASDDKQMSQESINWGGGHGVFTYYLLRGLKGEADYNHDQSVSLGELIPFLSEKVRRETNNAQSPTITGRFDPALTISR